MTKIVCNHTSVGMLVFQEDALLLIERKQFPPGFAPPAGHVDDGEEYETAAVRELEEEVGLTKESIELLAEGRKENRCRREGGGWHYWKIYKIEASGELARSESETKQAGFYSAEELQSLAKRTEEYLEGNISQEEWEQSPGIEPVWYEWLKELRLI